LKVSLKIPSNKDKIIILVRSVFEVLMIYSFLTALFNMNIANANAVLQLIPLVVLFGSFLFLGKQLKQNEIIAVLFGLIGAIIVIRPGASDFNFYSIFALLAVASMSVRDLVTVNLNKKIPSLLVAFYSSLLITIVSFLLSSEKVGFMELKNPMFIFYSAVLVSIGYIAAVAAMRFGEVTFVSPFRYTALLWAIVSGFLFFSEIPKLTTIFGGLIIIFAGIYLVYNEKNKV
jgi:S-adenosylmethionine uptake transporter